MEQHRDEHITCADCGTTFVFTAAEASSFADKGLEPPKRCFECRKARRAQKGAPRRDAAPRGPFGGDADGYRSPMSDPARGRGPRDADHRSGFRAGPPRDDRGPRGNDHRAPAFHDDRGPRADEYRAPGFAGERRPRSGEYRAPGFRDSRGPRHNEYRAPAFNDSRAPRRDEYRSPAFQDTPGPRPYENRSPGFGGDRRPRTDRSDRHPGDHRGPGDRPQRSHHGGPDNCSHDRGRPHPHDRGPHDDRASNRPPADREPHAADRGPADSHPHPARKRHTERPSYPITCAQCGVAAEVPFKPLEGRELLCRDCYRAKKDSAA